MRARPVVVRSGTLELPGELVFGDEPRASIVLCHGIPGGGPPDPTDTGYPGFSRELAAHGYAVLWFNFRGCRDAPGDYSAAGWVDDVSAALDLLGDGEIATLPRLCVGSSAGGAAVVVAAARRSDVGGVATLAAPASMGYGGLVEDPAALLLRFRNLGIVRDPAFPTDPAVWAAEFDAVAAEGHVAAVAPRPLLVVHGDADGIVPYPHAERLFAAAGVPKELVRVPGGGHQLRRDPRTVDILTDWLGRHRFAAPGVAPPAPLQARESPPEPAADSSWQAHHAE